MPSDHNADDCMSQCSEHRAETDNTDTTKLTYDELQAEYERSQWTLAWALKALGGFIYITPEQVAADQGKQYRVYYSDNTHGLHCIQLKEHK